MTITSSVAPPFPEPVGPPLTRLVRRLRVLCAVPSSSEDRSMTSEVGCVEVCSCFRFLGLRVTAVASSPESSIVMGRSIGREEE